MSNPEPTELVLTAGPAANGGSCVARHDGRVVFVRYALPGEVVRVRVTADRGAYWHGEAIEVLEASPDRIEPLCPIAGVDGSGCCDLSFADPAAVRVLKGEVVANQLARLGNFSWQGVAEPVGPGAARGWRTRVRLAVGSDGRAGFHRYHSTDLVTDLRCGQLPDGMLDGLDGPRWPGAEHLHVVIDDEGTRHVATTRKAKERRSLTVVEGGPECVQRVGDVQWRVPVTGFWQSHRDASRVYSDLVRQWVTGTADGAQAWDLYGGAGLFAAALADAVGERGLVLSVDTSRPAADAARTALADRGQVHVVSESVRRFLTARNDGAEVAVLDPPRAGAGKDVIELLAGTGVAKVIHIGCEAAAFARDIGLYQRNGYQVEAIRAFDAFPLTHHVECFALLTR